MPPGRPKENLSEKYDIPGKLEEIRRLYIEGAIDKKVADFIGCGITTFHKLKNEIPEIVEIQKESKRHIDDEVQSALLKRALGYEYEEKHSTMKVDTEGNASVAEIRTVTKAIPPDTIAAIFWMKNRRPEEWRDKHEVEGTTRVITGFEFEQVNGDTGEDKGQVL